MRSSSPINFNDFNQVVLSLFKQGTHPTISDISEACGLRYGRTLDAERVRRWIHDTRRSVSSSWREFWAGTHKLSYSEAWRQFLTYLHRRNRVGPLISNGVTRGGQHEFKEASYYELQEHMDRHDTSALRGVSNHYRERMMLHMALPSRESAVKALTRISDDIQTLTDGKPDQTPTSTAGKVHKYSVDRAKKST